MASTIRTPSLVVTCRRTAAGTAKKAPVKSASSKVFTGYFPGGLYPEGLPGLPGGSPYDTDWSETLWPNWSAEKSPEEIAKIAETELIHGRWAMLGTAGAWAAEVGTGVPWFKAGALCTPDDCTALANFFPGELIPLAPEGSGFPSFYNVLAFEVLAIGIAESYRGGYFETCFKGLEVGDLHPGGKRFDPLGLVNPDRKQFGWRPRTFDLDEMKVAEIKHARLAMLSWLGYMSQAVATNCDNPFGLGSEFPSYIDGAVGPFANWQMHLANPVSENVWKYMGLESTAGYL
mmetsp:Transcript_20703/g.24893  ORF Transcript_20703/g.24893 Transcript_20703/m.24893 type:complete len:289 (-) Transcript_20703:58-924(-)|eukprot:CAMPEP_0197860424 /NCGR_PEP_ID=MMETSP1438-20131217/35773_1 /TAXON_ID=1461541 /ORGANISM="Pterosperma sp., Strain CCMP1384" /LENGTH=288 /DNA_ID=CAMNT_0043477275 /DNA_START=59 /DNA_END=925 /DNA_ORIENTATION=+